MPATVTTLDREIAHEERCVGLPTDQPLTDLMIAHRRAQIALVMFACGFVALFAVFAAVSIVQMCAVALAGAFGIYAIEQDRHLRRLGALQGDSRRITLVVAEELLYSGALAADRELLDLRDGVGRNASNLAHELSRVVPADCTRVRLVGPSGEVPVAAERDCGPERPRLDGTAATTEAIRRHAPVRKIAGDHTVLAVPIWRDSDLLGVLEAISPAGRGYAPIDASLVDAFARGAVAALLA